MYVISNVGGRNRQLHTVEQGHHSLAREEPIWLERKGEREKWQVSTQLETKMCFLPASRRIYDQLRIVLLFMLISILPNQ